MGRCRQGVLTVFPKGPASFCLLASISVSNVTQIRRDNRIVPPAWLAEGPVHQLVVENVVVNLLSAEMLAELRIDLPYSRNQIQSRSHDTLMM